MIFYIVDNYLSDIDIAIVYYEIFCDQFHLR
jgi:hypothetical protein